jgi:hypothetical protein
MNKLLLTYHAVKAIYLIIALLFPCFADVMAPLFITPGYGISDYFQLMPGKVKHNNSILHNQLRLKKELLSLKLIKNTLCLDVKEYDGLEQPKISIFTISGKLVYRFNTIQNVSRRATNEVRLPQLSKGIYFVNVQYHKTNAQIKIIYTDK